MVPGSMLVINTLQRLEIVFWYHLGRVYFHFKFLHLPYIISSLRVRFQSVVKKLFLSVVYHRHHCVLFQFITRQ